MKSRAECVLYPILDRLGIPIFIHSGIWVRKREPEAGAKGPRAFHDRYDRRHLHAYLVEAECEAAIALGRANLRPSVPSCSRYRRAAHSTQTFPCRNPDSMSNIATPWRVGHWVQPKKSGQLIEERPNEVPKARWHSRCTHCYDIRNEQTCQEDSMTERYFALEVVLAMVVLAIWF